ncbi:uncharacterized protein BJX67DRAFT_341484 [Aspergillus lucknowensis]|uniref:Uncharacterized protein n=1 Tax=Aspergillus lucknowensis TaxID=176173 RepID=A0ABR4M686_9EURO
MPRQLRLSTLTLSLRRPPPPPPPRLCCQGLPLRSIQSLQSKQNSTPSLYSKLNPVRPFSSTPASASASASPNPNPNPTSSGKSQADLIVQELQELYETATDELEIATESTDSATIYAASDRESARDALNSLLVAFELYTSSESPKVEEDSAGAGGGDGNAEEEDNERLIGLMFDPADVPEDVREEVRRRVGQRVREVRSAVENLEARVHD